MEPKRLVDPEEQVFLTAAVTTDDLEQIVSRTYEINFVHHNHMKMIQSRVTRLLEPEKFSTNTNTEISYLRHLGALSVLEHLPEV